MPDQIQNNPFNRPPRIQENFRPIEIELPAPPTKPEEEKQNLLVTLLPMSSFVIMGLFYAFMFSGTNATGGLFYAGMMIALAGVTFVTTLIITSIQKDKQKKTWIKTIRDYHRTLDKKESRLLAARQLQLDFLNHKYCSPHELLTRVQNLEITLWEKRTDDPDFLTLRIGRGEIDSAVKITSPDRDMNNKEIRRPIAIHTEYKKIANAPVAIDLKTCNSIALVGRRNSSLPLSRALITQIIARNSPEDVKIFLFSSESCYQTWQWLRWLPHTSQGQNGGQPDYMAFTRRTNKKLVSHLSQIVDLNRQSEKDGEPKQKSGPAVVLVMDKEIDIREEPFISEIFKNGSSVNIFSIVLCNCLEDVPSECQGIISLQNDAFVFSKVGTDNRPIKGKGDNLTLLDLENLSHRLLPIAIKAQGLNYRIPSSVTLLQSYEANKLDDLKILQRWQRVPSKKGVLPFPVSLGNETYATPFSIHLAENLDGPHGLIAGTTGSGKSELIQSLVSALALEHHPYFVNFLLIDFKGGSTFGIFAKLPHVVGMVSNLDKLTADRALSAIKAEIIHRENFLKERGLGDINSYHKILHDYPSIPVDWKPLPHLFIIVDEFAQMAQEMPDFLPQINTIGALGRSLGIHLILATQRPAGVVTDKVRANLNFRICLRVQTVDDSRDILLKPDAASLPHNLPGRAYFQLGDLGIPRLFQVARTATEMAIQEEMDHLYRLDYEQGVEVFSDEETVNHSPSIAALLAEKIETLYAENFINQGFKKLPPLLLDPLPKSIKISDLFGECSNLWISNNTNHKNEDPFEFKIPVGIIDSLSTKTQPPHWVDFTHFGGHLLIVGGPQSGKTSLLQTIVYALCSRYRPDQVHIYGLSFTGRGLEIVEGLPHVGKIIQGSDSERFHRLIRFLQNQIEFRKENFAKHQAQDLNQFNQCVSDDCKLPNICLMIDGFGELRNTDYIDELSEIERIIQVGRTYGIYFVITALQANDIHYRITNLIQQRIALNLADHTEYMAIVGKPESADFENLPKGRCFISGTTPPMQCQIGLPPDKEEWKSIISAMDIAWKEQERPVEIGTLKQLVYLSEIVQKEVATSDLAKIEIGIDGDNLCGFGLNLSVDNPHYLIGGTSQSGRTSLLQSIVLSIANQFSPEQLSIVLIDGSGKSLASLKSLPHVIEWVKEEDGLTKNIANLESELAFRRKNENNKNFSHIFFVIDDYDQLAEAISIGDDLLLKLSRHIRQDSDLDFHFLITVSPDYLNGSDPLIKQIKLMKSGISLSSIDTIESMGGVTTSAMHSQSLIQGRGYIISRSGNHLVQFANPDLLAFQVVEKKWQETKRATWKHPANDEEIKLVREESAPVSNRTSSKSKTDAGHLIDLEASLRKYKEQQMKHN